MQIYKFTLGGFLPKKNNGVFPCCLGSSGIGTEFTQPTQKTQPSFGWFGMIGGIMGPYFPYKVDPYQLQIGVTTPISIFKQGYNPREAHHLRPFIEVP